MKRKNKPVAKIIRLPNNKAAKALHDSGAIDIYWVEGETVLARERDEKAARAIWQHHAKTKWASEDGTTQGRDDDKPKGARISAKKTYDKPWR